MGIAVVGTVGIHHSDGFGEGILAFVVVGDHQVDAQTGAQLGFLHGGDATVHRDDQGDTLFFQLVDGNGVQTVAFLQPSGDVGDAMHTKAAQKMGEQAGGGDAIHIVVTENGDRLTPLHGEP